MNKKISWFVIISVVLVTGCTLFKNKNIKLEQVPNETIEKFAKTIIVDDLYKHLSILASDEYEGRETAMEGQKKAAEYIKNHFEKIGLAPGNNGSYFQSFPVEVKDPKKVAFTLDNNTLTFLKEFYYLGNISDTSFKDKELVFVGYGIDQGNYSDYSSVNVEGKIVVVYEGVPDNKLVDNSWSNWRKKLEAATKNKAVAMITVQKEFDKSVETIRNFVENPRMSLHNKGNKPNTSLPNIYISEEALIRYTTFSQSKGFSNKTIASLNFKTTQILSSENVLGYIEGTDLKDEVLIITAHYDHIGYDNGEICNGADDDGSGTVALLELAEAFSIAKKAGNGPRRSILFMTVSGEEKGLLGSDYYSQNPIYALKNTIANLNIDMIGRKDSLHKNDQYVYLIGADRLSKDLHQISEQVNKKTINFELDYTYNRPSDPNMFYYRSDHYNFAKHGIPVIFYFSGVHEDYHKPTDDVEKILFPKLEKITQLIFYTAWELVNRNERIRTNG